MKNRPVLWNGVRVPYGASVEELARLVGGPAPQRWTAFVALAHTPDDAALGVLEESARSRDPHVRRIAAAAIGVHPGGARLASVVRALIADTDAAVVRSACDAAGQQRMLEVRDSVARLLEAKEVSTRIAAIRSIRELWKATDFEPVFDAYLHDSSEHVQREAAWTLRATVSASTWHRLFRAWHVDPLPRHRVWACEIALAYGDSDVLRDLRRLTGDVDGHVRLRARQVVTALEQRHSRED